MVSIKLSNHKCYLNLNKIITVSNLASTLNMSYKIKVFSPNTTFNICYCNTHLYFLMPANKYDDNTFLKVLV